MKGSTSTPAISSAVRPTRHVLAILATSGLLLCPLHAQSGRGLQRFDRNGNDRIERDEAPPRVRRRFDELDTNRDGALDRAELTRWFMGRGGQGAEVPEPRNLPEGEPSCALIGATLDRMIRDLRLDGAAYRVTHRGEQVCALERGGIGTTTQLNVASATKWVSGAVVLSLVEDGKLDLETPISRYLPDLPAEVAAMTLGQMLSHTSGLPGIRTDPSDLDLPSYIPLQEAARRIAERGLVAAPGTGFDYGGASFQIAGAVAEKVAGQRWEDLFQERIAKPSGMAHSVYGHPQRDAPPATGVSNPTIQAGLFTTLDDYFSFLEMIAAGGSVDDHEVLAQSTVQLQETARTVGIPKRYTPGGTQDGWEYGVGLWCEETADDRTCPVISSPGAWGTYPWIDRKQNVIGLLVVHDRLPRVKAYLRHIRKISYALID